MESFELMLAAGSYLPDHVKPWTYWMQVVLFLLPLVFLRQLAPRLLILSQILNTLVAYLVFVWEGDQVTKLFGLGHFLWLWPGVYLYLDALDLGKPKLYRAYAVIAVATIAISLVFDVRDTALWWLGNRESILVGMPQ